MPCTINNIYRCVFGLLGCASKSVHHLKTNCRCLICGNIYSPITFSRSRCCAIAFPTRDQNTITKETGGSIKPKRSSKSLASGWKWSRSTNWSDSQRTLVGSTTNEISSGELRHFLDRLFISESN